MNKLVRIIIIIIIAFILLCLCLYKFQLGPGKPTSILNNGGLLQSAQIEEAEGEVGAVDEENQMLTLIESNSSRAFSIDDKTAVLQAGRALRLASIKPGSKAKVKYQKRGRRLLAREIVVIPQATN